jgi:hypothetical protein
MQTVTKFKISGKQTCAYNKMERISVGDLDGHLVSVLVSEGVNERTGDSQFMDGAMVVNTITSDIVNYNGPFHGYSKITKKNDCVFAKFEGKITASLSAEGNPVVLIDGTIDFYKGTGQFNNIKGTGTLKGRYLTNMIYITEWEGDYWINK